MNTEYEVWFKQRGHLFDPLIQQIISLLDPGTDEQWRDLQFVNLLLARTFTQARAYARTEAK